MDTSQILADLRAERERLDRAIAALEALNSSTQQVPVAPHARTRTTTGTSSTRTVPAKQASSAKRRLSAAARKRISEAAKKRWEAWRKTKS